MTEPAKTNVFTTLNARLAPAGALISTIGGLLAGIALIAEQVQPWSHLILFVLSIIGSLVMGVIFLTLAVGLVLHWLLIKFLSDDGAMYVCMVLATIISVLALIKKYAAEPAEGDWVTACIGFLVVAYGVWYLVKKFMPQPSSPSQITTEPVPPVKPKKRRVR